MLSVRAKASNGASNVDCGFRRVYLRKREREYGRWRPSFLEGGRFRARSGARPLFGF